jgi:hypothetical protein
VVTLGAPGRDKLIANRHRKRKIREAASMQMAEFTAPNSELETAETMRRGHHAIPRSDLARDLCCR